MSLAQTDGPRRFGPHYVGKLARWRKALMAGRYAGGVRRSAFSPPAHQIRDGTAARAPARSAFPPNVQLESHYAIGFAQNTGRWQRCGRNAYFQWWRRANRRTISGLSTKIKQTAEHTNKGEIRSFMTMLLYNACGANVKIRPNPIRQTPEVLMPQSAPE